MRLILGLRLRNPRPCSLDFNYQHKLQANIYRIMSSAEESYTAFLHDTGYKVGTKFFKYFSYSYILTRFRNRDGRMMLLDDKAQLIFSTPLPETFKPFVHGLFKTQIIRLKDRGQDVTYTIETVDVEADPAFSGRAKFILKSPLVIKEPVKGYTFPYEQNPDMYARLVIDNLIHKYEGLYGELLDPGECDFRFDTGYLKKNRNATKRIKFWKKGLSNPIPIYGTLAPFIITAPPELIKTGYDTGFGINNSAGFGLAETINI